MNKQAFLAFAGDGLDRRAEIRDAPDELSKRWSEECILPLWRGKPLMASADDKPRALAFLDCGNALVADRFNKAVYLGEAHGRNYFAVDIPDWEDAHSEGQGFVDRTEQHHPDLSAALAFADLRANMTRLTPQDAEIAATAKSILGWHKSHRFCACCGQESTISQAGWRRDCPSCGGQHFPRTDPVVIMLVTHGNSVLLGRSPGWPDKMYSLLAGFVEPGETLETAVRREVAEETGVPVGRVDYLASQPWPFPSSLMIGCAAEALDRDLRIDPNEIEDALWITREDLLSALAGEHDRVKPARSGAIAAYLLENWLAERSPARD